MEEREAWSVIAEERRALADLLDALTPEQWSTPSLCEGWTVREVAAHLMVGPGGGMGEFLLAWVRSGLSFDRANRLLVAKMARAPTAEIANDLRTHAENRFTPPTFDWHAPLTDHRLHTLDLCVPLGLDAGQPVEPWGDVLDFLVSAKARRGFVRRGRPRLAARTTDLEWSHDDAGARDTPDVRGPGSAMALALSGRAAGLDGLEGEGVGALRRWIET